MEKEIEDLKIRINNYSKTINYDQYYLANEIFNNNENYQRLSQQLKDEFLRIDSLVFEANTIANEMQEEVIYKTILHIPVSYFKPNERFVNLKNQMNPCEIGVQVKYEDLPSELWDREKFEWKLSEIKKIYNQWKISDNQERNKDRKSENLIGVANIYLKALFYHSKLDYIVPIINIQGKISGSLHVVLDQTESSSSSFKTLSDFQINSTTQGSTSEGIGADIDEHSLSNSQPSLEDEGIDELSALSNGKNEQMTVKFAIKEARDLPKMNAEHIICRYTFINPKLDQTVISIESSDNENRIFSFDHENEYTFPITDDFLSICHEGAISIEVWSQYQSKERPIDTIENAKIREISRRWKHVKRHVQFSLEIQELDPTGQWKPVEVDVQENIISGGIYRLKQGQSKRLIAQLRIMPRSDPMPLSFGSIRSVEIGSISTRKIDAPCQLDSYQDEDLKYLKREWLDLIDTQKISLESQMNLLNQQTDKTSDDNHRERILLNQLVRLADERNIAIFPPPGSGIPGAPASWNPPPTIEMHRPLVFLNTNLSNEIAGLRTVLTEEDESTMLSLSLIQQASDEICAVALWDPAIHESTAINQVTPQDTVIYLIVKINVLITEPTQMEVILRKRIAVNISKTEGWWPGKIFRNLLGYKPHKKTSVVYEIVSTIPKMIFTVEDSQSLSQDSIDKYLQYASTIDSILLLDRLRQEILLTEKCVKHQTLRKATSAPNIMPHKIHSPVNSRRENHSYQISSIVHERIISLLESDLNSSTPSLLSRSLFIEEEQLQPIQISNFQIKHTIDLDDDQEQNDENTLELKYLLTPKQTIENKPRDYSINCRVIVNTGHSVVNQPGIIRFIGEIYLKEGIWYGIELEKPFGKNNGSLEGYIYFQCPNEHGVFVRRDKLQFAD